MFQIFILGVSVMAVLADVPHLLQQEQTTLSPLAKHQNIQAALFGPESLPFLPSVKPLHRETSISSGHPKILRLEQYIRQDGSYHYLYETSNGIAAQEQGVLKAVGSNLGNSAQGSFQFTSPEGQEFSVTYTADENGFQPQGTHLPVPPGIPGAIQRSLSWLAGQPEQPERRF